MAHDPSLLRDAAFATLGRGATAGLARVLRPLAWIDGLITAVVVSPQQLEEELWLEHVCIDSDPGSPTAADAVQLGDALYARRDEIADLLMYHPEAYQPFLGGQADRVAGAADWAAGFRFGIRLQPEPWAPLLDADDMRPLFGLIFCLERDELLPEEERAYSPFADITPERREEMRRMGIDHLAGAIAGLYECSLAVAADQHDDQEGVEMPYERAGPKIGRNDPCPCGSGKKYKKCCLQSAT